jgi:peptide/nickel transport system substrate-binding protein
LWWRLYYLEITKKAPQNGGVITETIVGQPQSLNPLLASLNDADRDVSQLIYAGLLKYDNNGALRGDLAEKYEISPDGKVYTFFLKDGISWSDGTKITANDIVFTFTTLQNPQIQSPLRIIFQGVKIEKSDDKTVKFTLENPYFYFLENFTFGIIPQHIFKDIPPSEFSTILPKQFANSGPFKIKKIDEDAEGKIKSIMLDRNDNYYKKAYLDGINLVFVENESELLKRRGKSTSLAGMSAKNKGKIGRSFNLYSLSLPRYFAIFLNQESQILSAKEVREAMALATPKDEIINKVFLGKARRVDSLFLPENNIESSYPKYNFDINAAKEILEKNNWKDANNDGIREKVIQQGQNAVPLQFTIYTVDQKDLNSVAKIIQENWKKAGIKVEIKSLAPQELLQTIIKERKYDILLFGQSLMMTPEPYSFWHSSQAKYPGLNLSLYKNNDVDKLLNDARKETDPEKRLTAFKTVQQKIAEDIPAIFLYSPDYLYPIRKNVKGIQSKYIIDPSKRFINIENWYIKEKRVPKQ